MVSVLDSTLDCNKSLKINFNGGDLSSDAGLILFKEFFHKIGLEKLLKNKFKTHDKALFRHHTDPENLLQSIYQIFGAYFEDDCADELRHDPVMRTILNKDNLASQPTMSRFFNRMDESTMQQLSEVTRILRRRLYSVQIPEFLLLDLDSTLLDTYGKQEGNGFNYHYQSYGYHPLVCYDGLTGDLLKIQLRDGTDYSCTGVVDFLQLILNELSEDCPDTKLFLRGDSGFATPDLYEQCESNGISYAIRLKENPVLIRSAKDIEDDLTDKVKKDALSYAVSYGEFMYKAAKWPYARRVVCKVEKPANQMVFLHTFVVTNMDSEPLDVIHFYCKRGTMENFIKESKNGFDFAAVSSSSKLVNANRLQIHALAYNLFNWFKRLVLPMKFRKLQADTIRMKLIKIAAKVVRSARYMVFKLCSSCPYQEEFIETLSNIRQLQVELE